MGLFTPGVAYTSALIALLAAAVFAGCGGDDDGDTAPADGPVEQPAQRETTDPGPVKMPREALETIEEQAAGAAGSVEGLSDMDLLPAEKGARLIIERGALDEQKFCAAEEQVMQTEAGPEAEAAFESGWERRASGGLEGMGGAMYNALSVDCLGF